MSSEIKGQYGQAGLWFGTFTDAVGQKIEIAEAVAENTMLIGMNEGYDLIHLSKELAAEIIPYLQRFVSLGSPKPREKNSRELLKAIGTIGGSNGS